VVMAMVEGLTATGVGAVHNVVMLPMAHRWLRHHRHRLHPPGNRRLRVEWQPETLQAASFGLMA
jgi:hypothetical protein